jgi:quinol monooxygenase YgiN
MEGQVSWIIECAVKPGQLDTLKALLLNEMVTGTNTEPKTLNYEWYISDDGSTVHGFEKYADSEAMITHVSGFMEKWAQRFLACVDVTQFNIYGDPSPAARELLAGFGGTYLGPLGGFSR